MAHWIIEDKGFGGVNYTCSNCGDTWNEYYNKLPKDFCTECGEYIDEDANEYIEETKTMTVRDLINKLLTYSMDMPVKVSCGHNISNVTGVGAIVDMDTNVTSVDIYSDEKE